MELFKMFGEIALKGGKAVIGQLKVIDQTAEKVLKRLDSINFRNLHHQIRDLKMNMLALSPALAPVGATAVAVGGALGASFAAAGAAVGGFAAVAVSNLNDVFDAAEDIEKINEKIEKAQATGASQKQINKLLKERAFLMSQLSKEQQRAAKALADFKSFWDDFAKSFEKPVVDLFISSLEVLQKTLNLLKPAITAGINAMDGLMKSFSRYTETKEFQAFFQWMAVEAGPSITSFGNTAMNVFRGVINLLMAFTPLTRGVVSGIEDMSEKFLLWTQSLKGSEGFKTFMDYVRANGPKVWSILKSLANIGKDLIVALAPLGSWILSGLRSAFALIEEDLNQFANKIAEGIKKGDSNLIAQAFADLINRALTNLQEYIGTVDWAGLAQAISSSIAAQAGAIAPYLSSALLAILNSMVSMIPTLMPSIIVFAYEFATAVVDSLFNWATWQPLVQKHGWSLLFNLISLVFLPTKFAGILAQVLSKIPFVGKILAWMVTSLSKLGGPARGKFKEKFLEIMEGAKEGFKKKWPEIEKWIKQKLDDLVDYLLSKIPPKFKQAANEWVKNIKDGIKNLPKDLLQSGKNAASQLAKGLRSKAQEVKNAASSLARAIKDFLGWNSPTKKGPGSDSDKWAPTLVDMFTEGLKKGIPEVEQVANRMASRLGRLGQLSPFPSLGPNAAAIGSGSSSGILANGPITPTVNFYGTVNLRNEEDISILAERIAEEQYKKFVRQSRAQGRRG